MKRMIWFELRKIMRLRIWIAILGCFVVMAFFFTHVHSGQLTGMLAIQKAHPELITTLEGPIDPVLSKQYASTFEEGVEWEYSSEGTLEERTEKIIQQNYVAYGYQADQFTQFIEDLKDRKLALVTLGEKDSYAYKDVDKQLTMMERIPVPGFHVVNVWASLFGFVSDTVGSLFMGIILMLALATLFSGEADYNMDALILSSRYGRRSIVAAKVVAGLLFTVSWVTTFYTISLLAICLPFKFTGWDAPLNVNHQFLYSPYALTQLQAFFLQYVVALLAACALMLLFALISAFMKNSLSSMGLALTLVILPMISLPGVVGRMLLLLPSRLMKSKSMIEDYMTFNLFGQPVLYLTLAIFVIGMVLLGSTLL
ncbi:MAG: ABC transporter permease subunit, partial [Gorillibacterium sp.]|nr:ABC transporter permease subunit [Gorillibacterium sp.]